MSAKIYKRVPAYSVVRLLVSDAIAVLASFVEMVRQWLVTEIQSEAGGVKLWRCGVGRKKLGVSEPIESYLG